MKKLLKTSVVFISLAASPAWAEYKAIGTVQSITRLGNLQKCDYRLTYKTRADAGGTVRLFLDTSSAGKTPDYGTGTVNQLRKTIDDDALTSLNDAGLMSLASVYETAIGNLERQVMLPSIVELDQDSSASSPPQVSVRVSLLDVDSGAISSTRLPLPSDKISIEENCSSPLYAAKVQRSRR